MSVINNIKRVASVRTDGFMNRVRSLKNRSMIAAKDQAQARENAFALTRPQSLDEKRDDLLNFNEQYEVLVELLCDAAKYGPEDKLEQKYCSVRSWMLKNYASLRDDITPFVQVESASRSRSQFDSFEVLFISTSLDEFLRGDDGSMIQHINRTRNALGNYAEDLRSQRA
jgi:hypothetical protein